MNCTAPDPSSAARCASPPLSSPSGRRSRALRSCARAALALLAFAIGCGPTPLEQVGQLMSQGKDREAIEILEDLVDRDPTNPELQYAYGWALHRIGRPDRGQWPLRECLKDETHRIPASRLLAEGALFMQDWDGVYEATDRILEELPEDIGALMLKARAEVLSRTNYEKALETADRLLEIAPDNTQILPIRTAALLGLERLDEVAEALGTLEMRVRDVELGDDGAAHACATKGTFMAERQELEKARKIFMDCFEEFPGSPLLVTSAVEFFENVNDPRQAIELLEKHLEEAPGSGLKHALASRLSAFGRFDDAEALLRQDTESDDPRVQREGWLDLVKHFQRIEEWDKAADCAEKALEVNPDPPTDELLLELADASVLARRYDRALAVTNDIEAPAFRSMMRGRVAIEQRRYRDALDHFESGLKLWPNNAVGRYYAAKAAEALNDWERAIEEYRWAIRSGASQTNARARLGLLYEARKQPVAAWEVIRTNLRDAPPDLELSLVASRIAGRLGQMHNPTAASVLRGLRTPRDVARAAALAADGIIATANDENSEERSRQAIQSLLGNKGLDLKDPNFAPALSKASELLVRAGRSADARKLVDAALEAQPQAGTFHTIHGQLLQQTGQSGDAVRAALEKGVKLAPSDPISLLALGTFEHESGNHQKALDLFEKIRAIDDENPDALYGAAVARYELGQTDLADELLTKLLEEVPFHTDAAREFATRKLERGAADERVRVMAQRLVEFDEGPEATALLSRVESALGGAAKSAESS